MVKNNRLSPGNKKVDSITSIDDTITIEGDDNGTDRPVKVDSEGRIELGSNIDIGNVNLVDTNDDEIDPQIQYPVLTATDSGAGSSNAAKIDLGSEGGRGAVDVFWDTSGSATLTVEVSKDDSTWRTFESKSISSADSDILQLDTAYRYVRAYLNQNRNEVEISAKGE